jgi:hypothetical protein
VNKTATTLLQTALSVLLPILASDRGARIGNALKGEQFRVRGAARIRLFGRKVRIDPVIVVEE